MTTELTQPTRAVHDAVLDDAHRGDIRGALGTIRHHDPAPRQSWKARLLTLLAVMGPGLIVMVGDNEAGGVATYAQAGQNYGTIVTGAGLTDLAVVLWIVLTVLAVAVLVCAIAFINARHYD
jgi:hypothetical protein